MINYLPNEIINYIIKFLDIKNIDTCYKTSKIFHQLTENEYKLFLEKLWEEKHFSLNYFLNCDINEIHDFKYFSKIIFHYYKYNYICTSIKNNEWYEFKNNQWERIEQAYSLRNKISEEFYNKLIQIYSDIFSIEIENGFNQNDKFIKKADQVFQLILEFKKSSFKNKIMDQCKILFNCPLFSIILNSKKKVDKICI